MKNTQGKTLRLGQKAPLRSFNYRSTTLFLFKILQAPYLADIRATVLGIPFVQRLLGYDMLPDYRVGRYATLQRIDGFHHLAFTVFALLHFCTVKDNL